MQFYKFSGIITNPDSDEELTRPERLKKARSLARTIASFNRELDPNSFFTIEEIEDGYLSALAITDSLFAFKKNLKHFIRLIKIDVEDIEWEEITFENFNDMLEQSARNAYIRESEEILKRFSLDVLGSRWGRTINFGENLIELSSRKNNLALADGYLVRKTLVPELERIYSAPKRKTIPGHPVHYVLLTDSDNTRKETYRILLSSLYASGRLKNRRYCFTNCAPDSDFSANAYDDMYNSCEGGCVVVRFVAGDDDDSQYVNSSQRNMEIICSTMKKYRNKVLTVLCFPRECEQQRKDLYSYLANLCFVEIKEEPAYDDDARDCLSRMAREMKIEANDELLSVPKAGKGYLLDELQIFFDEWYDKQLREKLFPEYREDQKLIRALSEEKPAGSAYEELMGMTGLESAKKIINQALDYYKAQKLFKDLGMQADHPCMHMCFLGSSGTCKTTVARLFARILQDNGILSKGHLVEVSRKDLVAKYVGHTAKCVEEKLRQAKGGVLFIDEAYSLANENGGSFGQEAIDALVKGMEDYRENLVVIFAGYNKEMQRFIEANSGIKSRIAFHINFEDYSVSELGSIADYIAKSKGLQFTEAAKTKLEKNFEAAKNIPDFGNGRYVRNVIELSRLKQSGRLMKMDFDDLSREDVATITAEDLVFPNIGTETKSKSIGFCA